MNLTMNLMGRPVNPPLALLALSLSAFVGGCGGDVQSPHPVQATLARSTLQDVLQCWKDGDSIESWRERNPHIVVQDLDWMAGRELEDFEILDDGEAVDANLHCQVRLTLDDADADPVEQTVTYFVTTSPNLTVFRQIIP